MLVQEILRQLVGYPDRAVNLEVGGTFRQPLLVSSEQPQLRCPDGRRESLVRHKVAASAVELDLGVGDGGIRISTAEDLAATAGAAPTNAAAAASLRGKLAAKVAEIRLNHVGLENAINTIKRQQEVPINVSWTALEEVEIGRTTQISLILRDSTLENALRDVLREAVGYSYFVEFNKTDQQGLYEVAKSVQGSQMPRQRFVVNPTGGESDLARLGQTEVAALFSESKWTWVKPEEAVEEMAARLHTVIEIAPGLLWALVALLGVESFLAWRFGRRRGEVAPS